LVGEREGDRFRGCDDGEDVWGVRDLEPERLVFGPTGVGLD
jgi:hypothetical protein